MSIPHRGCESQDDKCLQEVSERPEDDQGLLREEDHSGSQKSSKDEGGSCVDQSVVQCETGSKSRRDGPERNGDDPEYDALETADASSGRQSVRATGIVNTMVRRARYSK